MAKHMQQESAKTISGECVCGGKFTVSSIPPDYAKFFEKTFWEFHQGKHHGKVDKPLAKGKR